MNRDVRYTIHKTSVLTATIGAILSPIPLADELVFVPVYGVLARRIGRAHGLGWTKIPWRPIARTALNGLTARALLNLAVATVPGVAAVANAASAAVLTELFGDYVDGACDQPELAKALGLKVLRERLMEMVRNRRKPAPAV